MIVSPTLVPSFWSSYEAKYPSSATDFFANVYSGIDIVGISTLNPLSFNVRALPAVLSIFTFTVGEVVPSTTIDLSDADTEPTFLATSSSTYFLVPYTVTWSELSVDWPKTALAEPLASYVLS